MSQPVLPSLAPKPPQDQSVPQGFAHVTQWVFDLDNTLYPPDMRLFDQIELKMTAYVMRELRVERGEADRLRAHYWQLYGTTLAGLMHEHDMDPLPFLRDVHDISFAGLRPDPRLREAIAALPGRKIVFTNGTAPYARNVVAARGLEGLFDGLYGVEDADFCPKPNPQAFATVFAKAGITPHCAAMFEDDARNLAAPHAMAMQTIHVGPTPLAAAHIGHHTADLAGFLLRLTADRT